MSNTSDSDNAKTLKTYNQSLQAYVDDQPEEVSDELREFIRLALAGLPKTARILELGSGPGRDAEWIQSQGYKVTCSDAAEAFVAYMKSRGLNSHKLDVLTDDYGGPYDLIYASALLLHFTGEETAHILRQMHGALAPGGLAAIRTKEGDAATWTDEKLGGPRYMHYYDSSRLTRAIEHAGFHILNSYLSDKGHDNKGIPWIHVIARKEKNNREI